MNVLITDDEIDILEFLEINLKKEGFSVYKALNGKDTIDLVFNKNIDFLVLDVMLPDIDGFKVLQEIRKFSNIPVILLTAKTQDLDKILGLESGADDYITKPFNPKELIARMKSIIRRLKMDKQEVLSNEFKLGNLIIDKNKKVIKNLDNNKIYPLSAIEFDILNILLAKINNIVTKEEIALKVFSGKKDISKVQYYISSLKTKLKEKDKTYLKTIRKKGYMIVL